MRFHATLAGLEPFTANIYTFGGQLESRLGLSLPRAREMTRNGRYGQLPMSIGSEGS